jgi:oxaloacetate decarboxylase gamma subunit
VTVVCKIIHALGADKDVYTPPAVTSSGSTAKTTAVAAAITAAVTEYQKSNK